MYFLETKIGIKEQTYFYYISEIWNGHSIVPATRTKEVTTNIAIKILLIPNSAYTSLFKKNHIKRGGQILNYWRIKVLAGPLDSSWIDVTET